MLFCFKARYTCICICMVKSWSCLSAADLHEARARCTALLSILRPLLELTNPKYTPRARIKVSGLRQPGGIQWRRG